MALDISKDADVDNEKEVDDIIFRWDCIGFLDNMNDGLKKNVALSYDSCARGLMRGGNCSVNVAYSIFPIVRRIVCSLDSPSVITYEEMVGLMRSVNMDLITKAFVNYYILMEVNEYKDDIPGMYSSLMLGFIHLRRVIYVLNLLEHKKNIKEIVSGKRFKILGFPVMYSMLELCESAGKKSFYEAYSIGMNDYSEHIEKYLLGNDLKKEHFSPIRFLVQMESYSYGNICLDQEAEVADAFCCIAAKKLNGTLDEGNMIKLDEHMYENIMSRVNTGTLIA